MPTKIETSLDPERLREFFAEVAKLPGARLRDIQAAAAEFGVEVSLMAARRFKAGPFQDYLAELRAKREMAEHIAAAAQNGLALSDAAATILTKKILDQSIAMDEEAEDGIKNTDALSRALSRLRSGDQRARKLAAELRALEQRMRMVEFDAARAALAHARELRALAADRSLDDDARLERVRKILWGDAPQTAPASEVPRRESPSP
jgi:hypothetical protein